MSYWASNLDKSKHCFFGKNGGASTGVYEGLNFNFKSSDNLDDMKKNREIVASKFGLKAENLLVMSQMHGTNVEFVETASLMELKADAAVTNVKNVILGVGTADCAPVLFADYENQVIAVAHASWKCSIGGLLEKVVDMMISKGAKLENIFAAVGPCFGRESYEVRDDLCKVFVAENPDFAKYFTAGKSDEYFQFDLEAFVFDILKNCGLKNVTLSGLDTYALKDDYYSYRRHLHQGFEAVPNMPTQISCIVL